MLLAALALAVSIGFVQRGRSAEGAVALTGLIIGSILIAVPGSYLLLQGRNARPSAAGLTFLGACAVCLLGIYLYWVSSYVFFPADDLIWAEGDFVNDIIKFSAGYPLYSPEVNNDSLNYVPGAQLLTYFLAYITGHAGSIPAYRVIQLCFAAVAAFLATLCTRRLLKLAFPQSGYGQGYRWNIFFYATLFLIATNSITSHFAHNLHADSLAEVANLAAFYLLLRYIESRSDAVLAMMAVLVTAAFFVRQNNILWVGLYAAFLFLWQRDWKRLFAFVSGSVALLGAALAVCFALWGQPFFYWVFVVLFHRHPAPLRSFQHLLDAWAYFAVLLLGGAAVLRGRNFRPLLLAWLSCLSMLLFEAYTSGMAWMLNHLGPGSLMAGAWLLAGMASVWNAATDGGAQIRMEHWVRSAAIVGTVAFMFSGLGFVRIPLLPLPADAYRYVHDIEKQFERAPAKQILLDLGAWAYWKDRAVVGDRATSFGDRGYLGTGDFSGVLSRIASKHYSLILVHGYHSFDFVYDYYLFPKSTGIRKALQENYRETGSIRAVENNPYMKDWAEDPFYFGEITILEPKPGS